MRQDLTAFEIERHKAAIIRTDISRPVRLAMNAGLFTESCSFFDYGCGHGGDIKRLAELGFKTTGWDPYFRPTEKKSQAEVVNLGYVLNVIENPKERQQALMESWSLATRVLIVSAQVLLDYLSNDVVAYGDGVVTKRNTFQKYFEQEELKNYIDSVLQVDSVPVGLGTYVVFRNPEDAESFKLSRFHSKRSTPQIRLKVKTFEEYENVLKPLMDFVSERGRLPLKGELNTESNICAEFGSITRAFKIVLQATSSQEWEELFERRKQDLLLYVALSKFSKRPKLSDLPNHIKLDLKSLLGSYKTACELADNALFSLGQAGYIHKKCAESKIGKLLPDSLYVHLSALDELDLSLRLYEGCASRTVGRMDGATIVKFHTDKPRISYLFYPDFETDPHPALHTSVRIDLQDLHVKYSDYVKSDNPPVLHRKETFLSKSHPLYQQFAELTKEEEDAGLLDNAKMIGTRAGWEARLRSAEAKIVDHKVVKTSAG
ncbi:MAG: DNA phosphorothioation-associated putative methyltransferase [Candidatus Obscuribacter sp.]|nr:DNA phosphorothioation-associated putative methyltransferase [Candidatus Obscuribacter sp.]